MAEDFVGIGIVGDRRIDAKFSEFPAMARAALKREIAAITGELFDAVEAAEPKRTGKLKAETRQFVDERGDMIRGRVVVVASAGGPAEHGKAAALEFGAHGAAAVKAHMRTVTQIYGRMVAPTQIMVGAYSRQLDITARSYLRGPLEAKRADIIARLQGALDEAAAK